MKNLKIFYKLLISFSAILLVTFILGITALVSINHMDKISDGFSRQSIPSINYLSDARFRLRRRWPWKPRLLCQRRNWKA